MSNCEIDQYLFMFIIMSAACLEYWETGTVWSLTAVKTHIGLSSGQYKLPIYRIPQIRPFQIHWIIEIQIKSKSNQIIFDQIWSLKYFEKKNIWFYLKVK